MKIIDKIDMIRSKMIADKDGNAALGKKMQKYACLAVLNGIKSMEWHEYMRMFASNDDQLRRLLGEDDDFNNSVWGRKTLAYIVADGCCGIATVDTSRLSNTMRNGLDEDVKSVTESTFG